MLINCLFSNKLKDIKMVFKPLNKVQHQSKSNSKNIKYVISK